MVSAFLRRRLAVTSLKWRHQLRLRQMGTSLAVLLFSSVCVLFLVLFTDSSWAFKSLFFSKSIDAEAKEEFEMRRKIYQQGCKQLSLTSSGNQHRNIIVNRKHKLAYCIVPKVGCTFWKRLFRFIDDDMLDPKKAKSLFDIDRSFAHHSDPKYELFSSAAYNNEKHEINALSFMFTRNPYERLWSAYIDKILLPDFWASHGLAILADRRNMEARDAHCPDDISFEEFLLYAFRAPDDHWRPMTLLCDPCTFHPQLIGRLESFSRDRDFILSKANLSHLVKDHGHRRHAEDEVRIVTDYNFGLYKENKVLKSCLTRVALAQRLWRAFLFNGYIRTGTTFPTAKIVEGLDQNLFSSKEHVIKIFLEQLVRDPLSEEELHEQRQQALHAAYSFVSSNTRKKFKRVFEKDFLLFGYNSTLPTGA